MMPTPEDNPLLLEEFDRLYTLVETRIREAEERVREDAAKLIEGAQIFHCWGDAEINGIDVQKRLAAAIREKRP